MKKKHSQGKRPEDRKKNYGIWFSRNTAVSASILGALIIPSLLFSHGNAGGFFKALAIEAAVLLCLSAGILYLRTKAKKRPEGAERAKKQTKNQSYQKYKQESIAERTSRTEFRSIRKNYNWIIEDGGKSRRLEESTPAARQEEKKPVKFTPYRSPFERINPPREDRKPDPLKTEVPAEEDTRRLEILETAEQRPDVLYIEGETSEIKKHTLSREDPDINGNEGLIPILAEDGISEEENEHSTLQADVSSEKYADKEDERGYTSEWEDETASINEAEEIDEEAAELMDEAKPTEDIEAEAADKVEAIEEAKAEFMVEVKEADEAQGIGEISFDAEDELTDASLAEDEAAVSADIAETCIDANEEEALNTHRVLSAEKKSGEQAYITPPMDLLKAHADNDKERTVMSDSEYNAKKLIDTLASFGVGAKVINISEGPTVTRYELQPNVGVKVSKIVNLSDDIALNLAAIGVRIEAPIPGKAAVGIEVPNKEVTSVFLRDVVESEEFLKHPSKIAFAVGKDIAGNTIVADIARMPHLLIAGATGSGKSVCINTLIASILYKASPSEVKLLMVDPKVVELSIYNGIPHLLIPVVTDPKKAAGALSWAVIEMTSRYKLFADNNVRDLKGYNALLRERGETILPQIVIIIDELADLMMVAPNDVEDCICRLAQMARAAGMHLVIATQRPSVDVITGVIKANIPSRISFAVSSQIDSRTILDMAGAEKLLGRGDMLFSPIGSPKPVRVQGAFISDKEVEGVVSYIKTIYDAAEEYDEEILQKIEKQSEASSPLDSGGEDELLNQAINIVIEQGQASTSLIQRKLKVGYARAARILDQMEAWGVVGPPEGSKPRQIKITRQEWEELNS